MPRLECTIDHLPYAGVVYRNGDKFFASDEDARMLKGFGKAKDAPPLAQSEGEGESRAARCGGRYRRTDMRAED